MMRPGERFLAEAARAHAACGEEFWALCEACGLDRAGAQRLYTLLAFLAREARAPLRLAPPGSAQASADEATLCRAVAAMQAGLPWRAFGLIEPWLPARRRVHGTALLLAVAGDLAAAGFAFARETAP